MPRSNSLSSNGSSVTSEAPEVAAASGLQNAPTSTLGGSTRFAPGTATEKFRESVYKVMQMSRMSEAVKGFRPAGSEPGINPRKAAVQMQYANKKEPCEIEITDYSSTSVSFQQYNNAEFVQLMEATGGARPNWARVRWINIGGISWDVLSSLALAYDLHPLSLENVLHGRKTARSKADYYSKHLFIHILCQSLAESAARSSPLANALEHGHQKHVRVPSPEPMTVKEEAALRKRKNKKADPEHVSEKNHPKPLRQSTATARAEREDRINAADLANEALRLTPSTVKIDTKNLFIYLLRDGTVISIHAADRGFGDPIYKRLKESDTLLRNTSDPSLLLQAIIDLVVDRAIDIVDRFHESILAVERQVLIHPKMSSVRELHLLSGQLSQRRRELDPVKTVIYGLRRYDSDRATALAESSGIVGSQSTGFLSHKAKIYLADVQEHIEFIITSLEMFENVSENLINYTFNVIAYETNEVMRLLTLATIIFLPLTLLSGYFGMNFTQFKAIEHSDAYFWICAIPLLAVCIPLFLWRDFIRVWHYIRKMKVVKSIFGSGRH